MKYFALLLFLPAYLYGQNQPPILLSKIVDSVWVHTTYKLYDNYNLSSNGLIIRTSDGLILVDTPWDDSLTVKLIDSVKFKFNQDIVFAIVTHAHVDRMGGISTLHKKGIKVVAIAHTSKKSKELGFEIPESISNEDTTFIVGREHLELFYPGAGHTIDNSVVWLPEKKILFGGCLVKAEEFSNLGNIAEADLKEWPQSIRKIIDKFPAVEVVIPGHGNKGGKKLLQHTLDLLFVKN